MLRKLRIDGSGSGTGGGGVNANANENELLVLDSTGNLVGTGVNSVDGLVTFPVNPVVGSLGNDAQPVDYYYMNITDITDLSQFFESTWLDNQARFGLDSEYVFGNYSKPFNLNVHEIFEFVSWEAHDNVTFIIEEYDSMDDRTGTEIFRVTQPVVEGLNNVPLGTEPLVYSGENYFYIRIDDENGNQINIYHVIAELDDFDQPWFRTTITELSSAGGTETLVNVKNDGNVVSEITHDETLTSTLNNGALNLALNPDVRVTGLSAFEVWQQQDGNADRTEEEFLRSLIGQDGEDFKISQTFDSIASMNAAFATSDLPEGAFVMIVSDISDEDNSKMYVKGESEFAFVSDLSGAIGITGQSAFDAWRDFNELPDATMDDFLQSLIGAQGEQGNQGDQGISAYQVAVDNGFTGTEEEWLSSLIGAQGEQGNQGDQGISAYQVAVDNGFTGTEEEWLSSLIGAQGEQGNQGEQGISAYQVAVDNGFTGTEEEWLASLIGAQGEQGQQGDQGISAYQVAVDNGFTGTEEEWLASLIGAQGEQGQQGDQGISAYQVAVNNGFTGTEEEWLASLIGEQGEQGQQGDQGISAYQVAVNNGFTGTEEEWLTSLIGEQGLQGLQGEIGADGLSAFEVWQEDQRGQGVAEDDLTILNYYEHIRGLDNYELYKQQNNLPDITYLEYQDLQRGARGFEGDAGLSSYEFYKAFYNQPDLTEAEYFAAIKGERGNDFFIVKTYISVEVMNDDYENDDVGFGEFVMITSDASDPDNAKMYVKVDTTLADDGTVLQQGGFHFAGDLSGSQGIRGESNYQRAIATGAFSGTEAEYLASLIGRKGDDGADFTITKIYDSLLQMNDDYDDPNSIVQVGQFVMIASGDGQPNNAEMYIKSDTEFVFIRSLSEATAVQGETGASAYEVAVANGFNGTEAQWLESLKAVSEDDGEEVQNMFQIAQDTRDFAGTQDDFLDAITLKNYMDDGSDPLALTNNQLSQYDINTGKYELCTIQKCTELPKQLALRKGNNFSIIRPEIYNYSTTNRGKLAATAWGFFNSYPKGESHHMQHFQAGGGTSSGNSGAMYMAVGVSDPNKSFFGDRLRDNTIDRTSLLFETIWIPQFGMTNRGSGNAIRMYSCGFCKKEAAVQMTFNSNQNTMLNGIIGLGSYNYSTERDGVVNLQICCDGERVDLKDVWNAYDGAGGINNALHVAVYVDSSLSAGLSHNRRATIWLKKINTGEVYTHTFTGLGALPLYNYAGVFGRVRSTNSRIFVQHAAYHCFVDHVGGNGDMVEDFLHGSYLVNRY